jgi:ribosomal protein S18
VTQKSVFNSPTVEVKKKKYSAALKKNKIKSNDYKDPEFLRNSLTTMANTSQKDYRHLSNS